MPGSRQSKNNRGQIMYLQNYGFYMRQWNTQSIRIPTRSVCFGSQVEEGRKGSAQSRPRVSRLGLVRVSTCSALVLLGFLTGLQHMGSYLSTRAQATASSSSPARPPTRPPPLRPPPSSRPSQTPRSPPSRKRIPPVVVEVVRLVGAEQARREARTG